MEVCPSNSTTGSASIPRPYVQPVTVAGRDLTQKNPERGGVPGSSGVSGWLLGPLPSRALLRAPDPGGVDAAVLASTRLDRREVVPLPRPLGA